jgi:hypothetical protein
MWKGSACFVTRNANQDVSLIMRVMTATETKFAVQNWGHLPLHGWNVVGSDGISFRWKGVERGLWEPTRVRNSWYELKLGGRLRLDLGPHRASRWRLRFRRRGWRLSSWWYGTSAPLLNELYWHATKQAVSLSSMKNGIGAGPEC